MKERSPHPNEQISFLMHPFFWKVLVAVKDAPNSFAFGHLDRTLKAITTSIHYFSGFLFELLKK